MATTYPEDSLQALVGGEWWVETGTKELRPGRLVFAYIPEVDSNPRTLEPIGRGDNPADHSRATYKLLGLRAQDQRRSSKPHLPVAALPSLQSGVYGVYRTKRRPAIVLSEKPVDIAKAVTQGGPRWQSMPLATVVPAFGVKSGTKRKGWPAEFVRRIKNAEYPQYMWDKIPGNREQEGSIFRFDHIQPIGTGSNAFMPTSYVLEENALTLMRAWADWWMNGTLGDNELLTAREILMGE